MESAPYHRMTTGHLIEATVKLVSRVLIEIPRGFLWDTYRITGEDCLTTQLKAPNVQGIVKDAVADVLIRLPDFGNLVRPGYTTRIWRSPGNAIDETVSASGIIARARPCSESPFARSGDGARVVE